MCSFADTIDHCIGNIGSHKADSTPIRSVRIGAVGQQDDSYLFVRIDPEAGAGKSSMAVGTVSGQSACMTLIIILTIQIFSVETVPTVIEWRWAGGALLNDIRLEHPVSCREPVLKPHVRANGDITCGRDAPCTSRSAALQERPFILVLHMD